jgi:hypothetical protein
MSKETFFDQLTTKYRDDLEMILQETEFYSSHLDIISLNNKLKTLPCSQVYDLSEDDWLDLIYEVDPDLYNSLDFGIIAA